MAFSVRDKATDQAVRRLALLTGKGLTDTIRDAVEKELHKVEQKMSFAERIAAAGAKWRSYPATGLKADKAFYDSLNDE